MSYVPVQVWTPQNLMMPTTWYAVVGKKNRRVFALFGSLDCANDWLHSTTVGPDGPDDYEVLEIRDRRTEFKP